MDILWALLTLPYAPVRGVTAVTKVIAQEAESQLHNPINIRRELEELDRAVQAGRLTPEERDDAQRRVLERLTATPPAGYALAPSRTTGAVRPPTADRRAQQRRARGR